MNFNFDLFIDILWLGTLCGVISTMCVNKLKLALPFFNSRILSIFVNVLIGFSVSKLFTNLSIKESIAVGIITWIGAETIFDNLKNKKILGSTKEEELEDVVDDYYEDESSEDLEPEDVENDSASAENNS